MTGSDAAGSFELFLARDGAALLRFATRLTGDRASGEELLQQALVATALHWGSIRRRDDPGVYVRRTLVNARSRAWRRGSREVVTATVPEAVVAGDQAEVADRLAMRQALMTLAPRQRAVLVLRFYEDRSEEETAALLGCSRGTVKSQTSRALAILRARLDREVVT